MDESIEIEVKAKGIPELRSELKSLKSDLANATDPADIERLSMAAGTLADKITDINEKVAIFSAGSDFEKVNNGLSLVSDQLSNMDFEGASESAKLLTANIKNMNPAEIANGFKAFAGTIGELSKAFIQMGLKLLANPLFLLVAIIGGIVIAIVMLKDKIGILQKAFDMMMLPINLVIQALKDLGDMMGLTAFVAEESAERQVAAAKKANTESEKYLGNTIAMYDRKIALMKAEGKNTEDVEIEKTRIIQTESFKQIKILEAAIKAKKALLDDQTTEEKKATNATIDELTKSLESYTQMNLNAQNDIKVIKATSYKKQQDDANKASIDASNKKKQNDDKEKQELKNHKDRLLDIEKKYTNEIADLNAKTDEEKLALQKKREQEELNLLQSKGLDIEKAKKSLNEKYAILEAKLEEDRGQRILDITNDYTNKLKDLQAVSAVEKLNRQLEIDQEEENRAIEKLEKENATEEQIQAVRNYYDTLENDRRRIYNEELLLEEEQLNNRRIEIEQAYQDARRNMLDTGLSILSGFAKENKSLAMGILAVEKGLAIADVIIKSSSSIAKTIAGTAAGNAILVGQVGPIAAAPGIAANLAMATKSIATTKISAATSIASILAATIQSAKGMSGGGGSGGLGGSGGGSTQTPAPSFNLFGGKNQGNEATSSQTVESTQQNQTITVNAIVSETAITETQNRVQRIQQNAEL